jgi:DeoR family ulaG and ulaABCDEF operon transcriptional repressor
VGQAVIIGTGATTLQMCPHLEGLDLQVLTNSFPVVEALSHQPGTRVVVPGGQVMPEAGLILSLGKEDMPPFEGDRFFMEATAIGPAGLMQADVLVAMAERRLIPHADQLVVLLQSSKFDTPSSHVVRALDEIDIVITDPGIRAEHAAMLERAGVRQLLVNIHRAV